MINMARIGLSEACWWRHAASRPERISDRGNVAVEFALVLPVLLLLLLASAELGRYVLLNQKVDRVAITMSDLVARAETISEAELDDIFNAAVHVAEPFDLSGSGRVVISSVTNP